MRRRRNKLGYGYKKYPDGYLYKGGSSETSKKNISME